MDSTMKTFDSLPSELVCNIAARLHADDIASFRLVSRSLEQKSFHEFATEYFSEKCFMFTTDSLKVLLEIARGARLRPFLKHVHFMTAIFSERAFQCVHGCNCTWQPSLKQKEAFRDYIKDQKSLNDSGRDRDMLVEAFANLPNLTTLSVDDSPSMLSPDIDYRGSNKVPRLCGRGPMLAPHAASKDGFKEYDAFFQHVWELVTQSLQHCTALTHFATHLSKSSNGVSITLLDSRKFSKSVPALKGLAALVLRIRSYKRSGCTEDKGPKDVSKRELRILQKFANTLPSLETLDLSFDSTRATGLYLLAFTAGLNLENITTCYLDGIAIAASGLAIILDGMTSVKDLRMIFTNLTKGSWLAILKILLKKTEYLQHLHLMYLLEGGRKAYFLKQIEEDGIDPFDYEDENAFDDEGDEEEDTDDDLPPLEPGDTNVTNSENTTAPTPIFPPSTETATADSSEMDNHTMFAATALMNLAPSTTPGHSSIDHVRPGDEDSGERGYFVCIQGKEIERQLPIFIQEYNLGMDVAEEALPPGIGLMPGGMGGAPNFNNVLNALGAALGVPGAQPPGGPGPNAGGMFGGAGAPVGGPPGGTTTIPILVPPFVPSPAPAPSTNTASSSNGPSATDAASAMSALNFPWDAAEGDEWEDEEENDDMN